MTKCDQAKGSDSQLEGHRGWPTAVVRKGCFYSAEVSVPCLLNKPGDCLQQVRLCLMVKAAILTDPYPVG